MNAIKTRTTKNATTTYAWLMAKGRSGTPRIKTLTWGRLARIYNARNADRQVRQAIEREACRCGYRPRMILGLNRWESVAAARSHLIVMHNSLKLHLHVRQTQRNDHV